MRKIMIMAASAALFLAPAAYAQQQTTPPAQGSPPAQAAPEAPAGQPTIQSINIVDVSELPAEAQTQVGEIEKQLTDQDLAELRRSIDAMPQLKTALEAKGLTSEHVIVASLSQAGELTLVTRKDDS